jgi:2-polyprenyl-3-methyl-5-hydroxy-6-metoxy-1,4-benzoquinol methylase
MSTKSITDYPDAPDIESSTWGYAGRFAGPVGEWLLGQQVEATRKAFAEHFPQAGGLQVLDVGGGHGQNIALMQELGHELTIFGSARATTEVIAQALERGEATLDSGSLLKLPYDDDSFDVVICYRMLSHMESWQQLAGELSRVARGMVLVDYPCKRSVNFIADALFLLKKRIEKNTRRYGVFHDREIDAAFADRGRRCCYRYRQFFFPMALYRAIGNACFCRFAAKIFRSMGLTGLFGSPVIAGYI